MTFVVSSICRSQLHTLHMGLVIVKADVGLTLRWRHNGRNGVSNHQPHDCLLNRLFRRRSKKTSKFRVTGLCAGNSPGTGEFPAQLASNAENVSIGWRHHGCFKFIIQFPNSLAFYCILGWFELNNWRYWLVCTFHMYGYHFTCTIMLKDSQVPVMGISPQTTSFVRLNYPQHMSTWGTCLARERPCHI